MPSVDLGLVRAATDHLCSEDVLRRLRESAHVRDGFFDEFRDVLRSRGMDRALSRDDVYRVVDECGAADPLVALENCIRLVNAKAG